MRLLANFTVRKCSAGSGLHHRQSADGRTGKVSVPVPEPVRTETVDLFNYNKHSKSNNQKVNNGIDEQTVGQYRRACISCCFQGSVFFAVQRDEQVGEINSANHHAQRRHNYVVYQRSGNLPEGTADNNTYCHVQHVAANGKIFKFTKKLIFSTPVKFFDNILYLIVVIFVKNETLDVVTAINYN